MNIASIVFRQILMMFLMMGIGAFCYKIKFISKEGSTTLSDVALFVVLPCVVFTSFQIQYRPKILYGIIISFVLGFAAHLIAMGAAYLLVKGGTKEHRIIESLVDTMKTVGNMNTPLAMLVSGTAVAQTKIQKALLRPRTYWMLFLRLLAVPVIVICLLAFVPVSEEIRLITALGISAPTAAISTMFAVKYQKDVGYAAELFAISTISAIAAMPLMMSLAELLF